ncbi:MAG: tetratricopeptide repeat protein [Chitinophagales bacterium]
MKKIKYISLIIGLFLAISCADTKQEKSVSNKEKQMISNTISETEMPHDSIVARVFRSEVLEKYGLFSTEWQEELDIALAKYPTVAYLWQQKAMPLFKQGKYELAMPYLDKAVQYDRLEFQDYRAFMKCIFARAYSDAITDFEDCIKRFGNSYVMDHTYKFYIALSKIQLHEFAEAEKILLEEIATEKAERGADWVHHLDLYYVAIAKYEQHKYEDAILFFDKALERYPEFSEAQLYKSKALRRIGKTEAAEALGKIAQKNGKAGFTINEDNSIHIKYPYQIKWH